MNSRKCEICEIDVHRASYAKRSRSKKPFKNEKQNDLILPEWLIKEPIENKIEKIFSPEPLKQIAREKIKLDDKQLNKKLPKKMINPSCFIDRALQVGFDITPESHHLNHGNSKIFIKPNYSEFGIELRYIDKIIKEMTSFYAKLIDQYEFKHETVFSARFDNQDEDNQVFD